MKKILVPTDLSLAAKHAAQYALHLAKGIKADITLCNAIKVPAEAPMAPMIAWPLVDFSSLKKDVDKGLKLLAKNLTIEDQGVSHHPTIKYMSEVGFVTDVIRAIVDEQKINLVVMGMSGAGAASRFFLGSSSRAMINAANCPILLIPAKTKFKGIRKIAFTTDFSEGDLDIIHALAGLAQHFNAEILITHVATDEADERHQQKVTSFLNDVTCKVGYPKVYYRQIVNLDVDSGLNWMAEHGQLDMLAMVHHRHNLLERIFKGSHTQTLAKHIKIPLLVFPAHKHVLPI